MFLNNILGIDNSETTDVYEKIRRTYTMCKSTSNIQSMVLAEIFNGYNKFLLVKNMDLHKHPRPSVVYFKRHSTNLRETNCKILRV